MQYKVNSSVIMIIFLPFFPVSHFAGRISISSAGQRNCYCQYLLMRSALFIFIAALFHFAAFVNAAPSLVGRAPLSPGGTTKMPSWAPQALTNMKFSTQQKAVFSGTTLTHHIALDKPLSNTGIENEGIFTISGTYKSPSGHSFTSDQVIVKVLSADNAAGWAEVFALDKQGQKAKGAKRVRRSTKPWPVILMKRKLGTPFLQSQEYAAAEHAKGTAVITMENKVLSMKCEAVAELAVTKHLYHADNNDGNFLVVFKNGQPVSGSLVDYGGDHLYTTIDKVDKEVVRAYCKKKTKPADLQSPEPSGCGLGCTIM
ncbi:hypothetical protein BT96DRAFT_1016952 [Gymnopus androsaceus JB14]|uniref:Uncharacterized protein n=1 Tax=Gymnopus androsaceus JB14 TaxID=1447944 RepID=A0A6A4I0L8_9AGAR|nr:hypothetical protein BT96DRAFT_1016952 [Gymnopus androsaceus JB14]